MKRKKVIIDCDPGYDDAIALILALLNDELDIKAINATAGNQTIDKTYKNVIRICNYLDENMRIGKGVVKPLFNELSDASHVHGETGLDGVNIPNDIKMPKLETSIEVIKDIINESDDKITLIAIGPLTNIALFIINYPNLLGKIQEIIIMGGASFIGNRTPSAEFNIFADAEAARIVFESKIPIVMAGLDVTEKSLIYESEFDEIAELGKVGKFAAEILRNYNKFYLTLEEKFNGVPVHDICAVAYAIDSSIFEGKEYHVDVECEGKYTYGRTVVDFKNRLKKEKNVKVLFGVDRDKLVKILFDVIKNRDKE
ncbi:nucleoside hydrolase [Clostridiaceae bacterium HSG29]|nr:nucleoside hydrolase [Clostridiaceae bacterium HSG29]